MVRELPVDDSASRDAGQQRGVRGRMRGLCSCPAFLGALRGGRAGVQAGGDEALDEALGQRAGG